MNSTPSREGTRKCGCIIENERPIYWRRDCPKHGDESLPRTLKAVVRAARAAHA
jgi:hypothetical protein